MKYVIVIGDGMPDLPSGPRGSTPLQEAHHPNMDEVASRGVVGAVDPIPEGMEPGSDVAIMGLMGYDPKKYYTGRGPLEAAGIGIELHEGDLAFRCNLITEEEGVLADYAAGHIGDEEAKELITYLNLSLSGPGQVKLYAGVSYRHLLVLEGGFSDHIKCMPPHDAVGRRIIEIMVEPLDEEGETTAEFLNGLILRSQQLLSNHPINLERVKKGLRPANMIWPWGFGRKPTMPSFSSLYGLRGSVISAVNLVKGIGSCAGMKVIEVPGATGYIDTNYEGKADYALKALDEGVELVYIHVEAPDEAGHAGDFELKVKAIEDLDRRLLGRLLDKLDEDAVIAIVSDHLTPISVKTHLKGPIPFAYASAKGSLKEKRKFDEGLTRGVTPISGPSLLKMILGMISREAS